MTRTPNMPNTDIHVVHCAVSAPAWRSFRSVLALRGQTVRESLESWVLHVVAEGDVVIRSSEPTGRDDRYPAEGEVGGEAHADSAEDAK